MSKDLMDNKFSIDNIFDSIKDMVINSRNKEYNAVNTEIN